MAVGIDLGLCTGSIDERVVGRHATVIAQPQHLPGMASEIPCSHALAGVAACELGVTIAHGDIQHAVRTEQYLAAECGRARGHPRVGQKMSRTSVRALPFNRPRATASVVPCSPVFGRRRRADSPRTSGMATAMRCSNWRFAMEASATGTPETGCGSSTRRRRIRRRPPAPRSVTSMVWPSGRKAMLEGLTRPVATVTTRTRTIGPVPHPVQPVDTSVLNSAGDGAAGRSCACPADRPSSKSSRVSIVFTLKLSKS